MVPSTSALLVLLVAVATGRLVEGMILIVAFGAGMAAVLGGLAAATALARRGLAESATGHHGSRISRLAGAVPLASAVVIIMVGVVTTVGALGNL
jgi:ABC-type nickel/cobalt efflux system permease component RcnA